MNPAHLPLSRLEADPLSALELSHLSACARCRIDRRELRLQPDVSEPLAGLDLARQALFQARQTGAHTLVDSWRTMRSESGRPHPVQAHDLLPSGLRVGRYRVDALLGLGGMAIVYRMRHVDVQTWHALKVLSVPGTSLRERLLREGRLQAQLRHRNIVRVTDVVEVEGAPALVLEYVPGPTLHDVLRDGPLPHPEVDAIATDVLTGMAAAHAQGFVHRDLKPSNVLLHPTDDGLIAKVSDFGLAKALAGESLDALQTRTGGMLGTLLYMAPEQLRDARRADARSDVFALGAILYELVTGQRCFAGVDLVDIMHRVSSATRAPLSSDVPERWRSTLDAALALHPEARPADASVLLARWTAGRSQVSAPWSADRLDDLREHHEPIVLPQAPPERAAPSSPLRRRFAIGAVVAVGVLSLAGVGTAALLVPPRASHAAVSLVHQVPGAPGHHGGSVDARRCGHPLLGGPPTISAAGPPVHPRRHWLVHRAGGRLPRSPLPDRPGVRPADHRLDRDRRAPHLRVGADRAVADGRARGRRPGGAHRRGILRGDQVPNADGERSLLGASSTSPRLPKTAATSRPASPATPPAPPTGSPSSCRRASDEASDSASSTGTRC